MEAEPVGDMQEKLEKLQGQQDIAFLLADQKRQDGEFETEKARSLAELEATRSELAAFKIESQAAMEAMVKECSDSLHAAIQSCRDEAAAALTAQVTPRFLDSGTPTTSHEPCS